jgi:histidine triad (HIT) family protein
MEEREKTVFEKIIDRELPSTIEYENDEVIVIHDIHPSAPVHMLIIPKRFITSILDAQESDQALIGKMILIAKEVAEKKGLKGYKLLFNVGAEGGQVVPYLHLHLLGGARHVDLSKT